MSIHSVWKSQESQIEFQEWVDFTVEKVRTELWHILFYFKSMNWDLIWYIKTYYKCLTQWEYRLSQATIVDTVSSYKLEKNAPKMLELFQKTDILDSQ